MKYNFQSITLNITQGCNLRCAYCQVDKNPKIMAWEMLKEALDWCRKNVERPYISFFGGEPLLEYDKIKWSIENYPDIGFGLSTNITLLTPEKIKFFFEHHTNFLFSIDGIGEIHDLTRGNSWHLIKDKLAILGELFPHSVFRLTLTPKNISHLCETIIVANSFGFDNFNALPDGIDSHWTSDDYEEMRKQLTMLYSVPKYRAMFRPFEDYSKRLKGIEEEYQCCDGKTTISILTDGRLSLCGEQTEDSPFIVGDLKNGIIQEKLDNFWNQIEPCPIHCKANPICSKERCFSRRYFNNDKNLSERIKCHCRWYNIMEEVIRNGNIR